MSLTGNEDFTLSGNATGRKVIDFWRWSSSELNDNLLRAALGEYIVASAIGERCVDTQRAGWRVYDLLTDYGCKIEVKTSAHKQTWSQPKPSPSIFDIGRKVDWDSDSPDAIRHSDVYVFCVVNNYGPNNNSLDLSKWDFYVVATPDLNVIAGDQKTISLSALKKRLPFTATGYTGLATAILNTFERSSSGIE